MTAVNDGKFCWRLDNFLGNLMTKMEFWDYEDTGASEVKAKKHVSNMCATVHHVFRNYMGPIDQSNVKGNVMGLTRELNRHWYEKQFSFLVETSICNAFGNYNLDSGIDKKVHFTDFFDILTRDLLASSPNFRKKRKFIDSGSEVDGSGKKQKRSHHKKTKVVKYRSSKSPLGKATTKGLTCRARLNLRGALRFIGKAGSGNTKRFIAQRKKCAFCGHSSTSFKCIGCDQTFCMTPPTHLIDPDANPPQKFKINGLLCWERLHGFKKFSELPGSFTGN